MSQFFNKFNVCSKICENVAKDIKLFYVFNDNCDQNKQNLLFVTIDDLVFGSGYNQFGKLGFGHNKNVRTLTELKELRYKRVKEFIVGYDFVVALTRDNRLYTWGHNKRGQLGRGCVTQEGIYLRPEAINLPFIESIVQISCGFRQTLILTSDGLVYGFGSNIGGQLGQTPEEVRLFPSVTKVKALEDLTIRSIYSYFECNFVITNDDLVFSWGSQYNCLGRQVSEANSSVPSIVANVADVKDVCVTTLYSYFLTNIGKLFYYGKHEHDKLMPITIDTVNEDGQIKNIRNKTIEFKQLYAIKEVAVALNERWVYILKGNQLIKTEYKTILDFYANERKITHKTIEVKHINKERHWNWISKAFNDPQYSDLKFKIRRKNDENNYDFIYAHKVIVANNSDYFKLMFTNDWSENQSNEIEIKDYSYEAYYQYIQWLYTDSIVTEDIAELLQLLSISDQYLNQNFKDKCIEHLKSIIDLHNICSVYRAAIKFRAKSLEQLCVEIAKENGIDIVKVE